MKWTLNLLNNNGIWCRCDNSEHLSEPPCFLCVGERKFCIQHHDARLLPCFKCKFMSSKLANIDKKTIGKKQHTRVLTLTSCHGLIWFPLKYKRSNQTVRFNKMASMQTTLLRYRSRVCDVERRRLSIINHVKDRKWNNYASLRTWSHIGWVQISPALKCGKFTVGVEWAVTLCFDYGKYFRIKLNCEINKGYPAHVRHLFIQYHKFPIQFCPEKLIPFKS